MPESTDATTIIAYIVEAIGASQTDLTDTIAIAKSEAIFAAATDATTKANIILDDAKEYVDNKVNNLFEGQVTTNKEDIETLQNKVELLESVTYIPITESQINSLFNE